MTRVARTLTGFLLAAMTVMITTAAHADGLIVTHRIPAALALEAVSAAVQNCAAKGYSESAVVLDAGGNVQASMRGDGAGLVTLENAEHKASTALAFQTDTSVLVERAKSGGDVSPAINRIPRLILANGGVVIKFESETIGAIGASGAPGGEKDEACARAGLAKIADRLK